MQKSFVVSLALSFLFAFATSAYLSSPYTIHVQAAKAEAQTIESTSTPDAILEIPFSHLNIVSFIEATSSDDVAAATSSVPSIPESPTTQVAAAAAALPHTAPAPKIAKQTARPVRLIIPSIGLNTSIESVGLNSKGEMDVPDGNSTNVGWYKNGTIPGNMGSAVIDAHVFAAFEQLRYLKVGSEVYVENANGARLKFVVNDSRVYRLGELTSGMLFGRRDARRLNLITCAGKPTPDGSTYTHRLVVYTTLAA